MLTQSSLFIRNSAYRRGRQWRLDATSGDGVATLDPSTDWLNQAIWQAKKTPAAKSGTLRLDQGTYTLPANDLPGLTPLHLNENLFAAAKAATGRLQVTELLDAFLDDLHRYPTSGVKQLQAAIAADLRLELDQVVISPGSAASLRDVVLYLLKKGETMLIPAPSWSFYQSLVDLVAAKIDTFPLLHNGATFIYDRNLIAAKIEAVHPKVVLICSPNNPTGNVLPMADFLWLVREYPQVDFILDEAYYGFHESYSAAQERELLDSTDQRNVFVVRTFSKFYGLANLRLGFVICSEIDGRNLQKIAPVFGLPSLNQALAANRLADKAFQAQMRQEFAAVNKYVYSALRQLPGFIPYQTRANFILVQHDGRWAGLEETLLEYGYKIKRETVNGANNYFRITYADIATMKKLVAVLGQLAYQKMAA